jgi:hypothetical protein
MFTSSRPPCLHQSYEAHFLIGSDFKIQNPEGVLGLKSCTAGAAVHSPTVPNERTRGRLVGDVALVSLRIGRGMNCLIMSPLNMRVHLSKWRAVSVIATTPTRHGKAYFLANQISAIISKAFLRLFLNF